MATLSERGQSDRDQGDQDTACRSRIDRVGAHTHAQAIRRPHAAFRFARVRGLALLRAGLPDVHAANNDEPDSRLRARPQHQFTQNHLAQALRAQRTADQRLPDIGEMERLHDIHGGLFADGTDQGRP